jgi:triosephosphate isomerase (TIM)
VHGRKSLDLAKKIEKILPKAILAVSAVDINLIKTKTKMKVFAQHVDNIEGNRGTGFITLEGIKSNGANGTILNHSEHLIKRAEIYKTLSKCKKLNLKTVLCTDNLRGMKSFFTFKMFKPYAIAYEEPKLVGSGKSITAFKSKDVIKFTKSLRGSGIIPLCGAGISTAEDVKEAYRLGCKGVLIASAVAKVKNPEGILKEIGKINK